MSRPTVRANKKRPRAALNIGICGAVPLGFWVGSSVYEWLSFGSLNNGLTNGGLSYVNAITGLSTSARRYISNYDKEVKAT